MCVCVCVCVCVCRSLCCVLRVLFSVLYFVLRVRVGGVTYACVPVGVGTFACGCIGERVDEQPCVRAWAGGMRTC